jgi:hypothetical protein
VILKESVCEGCVLGNHHIENFAKYKSLRVRNYLSAFNETFFNFWFLVFFNIYC